MPTDDERREVAKRLRELGKVVYSADNTYELLADALGVDDFDGTDELFDRLADLIDPGDMSQSCRDTVACDREAGSGQESGQNRDTVQIESPAVQKAPECDREALLALAGGLEADADRIIKAAKNAQFGVGPRMSEAKLDAAEWRSIARRIREACGEVVG